MRMHMHARVRTRTCTVVPFLKRTAFSDTLTVERKLARVQPARRTEVLAQDDLHSRQACERVSSDGSARNASLHLLCATTLQSRLRCGGATEQLLQDCAGGCTAWHSMHLTSLTLNRSSLPHSSSFSARTHALMH
jgi:hypothetical protein